MPTTNPGVYPSVVDPAGTTVTAYQGPKPSALGGGAPPLRGSTAVLECSSASLTKARSTFSAAWAVASRAPPAKPRSTFSGCLLGCEYQRPGFGSMPAVGSTQSCPRRSPPPAAESAEGAGSYALRILARVRGGVHRGEPSEALDRCHHRVDLQDAPRAGLRDRAPRRHHRRVTCQSKRSRARSRTAVPGPSTKS